MNTIAVLFARADSVYKTLPGCDVWDIERDARKWPGGCSIVAHPPCRAWGRLAHMAKPRADEKDLAIWAVEMIRRWGGVLEHPKVSRLWPTLNLPLPGSRDDFGGFTLTIQQFWFGHRAEKETLLYICGVHPRDVPLLPIKLGEATHVIAQDTSPKKHRPCRLVKGMPGWRPEVSKNEREHTPPALAEWLVELARRCDQQRRAQTCS